MSSLKLNKMGFDRHMVSSFLGTLLRGGSLTMQDTRWIWLRELIQINHLVPLLLLDRALLLPQSIDGFLKTQ
jgi:hypothetical protein